MIELIFGARLSSGGELIWTSSQLAIGLAAAAALIAVALAAWSGRRSPTRWIELALLAPAAALLVVAAAGPVWVEESGHYESPRMAVLIDDSRSMGILEQGAPRHEQVREALEQLEGEVDLYTFGREVTPGGASTWDQGATDLGGALATLADRYTGEKLAGIAVISDGLDRGGLREAWQSGDGLTLPELPGPLTLYQVGSDASVKDVAITDVETGGFAFLRQPFTLTAEIVGAGFEGWEVPVSLTRDGKVIAEQEVTLDDDGRGRVWFQITPKEPGRFSYAVSAPVWEGDSVPANNDMHVAVRVVRDRMRILQVCGAPSFDQKFLRLFLKQDPSVDLVSFFILRTNEDMHAGYSNDELSLIPFPYESLFDEQLETFDVVIFQNFDYAPFFQRRSDELLSNLSDFVIKGGAFVMMGGDRSFDLGDYGISPLVNILPVTLGVDPPLVAEAAFRPTLTAAGRVHPITQLLADPLENQALWERLSPLDGVNLSSGLAPGSAALLTHPDRTTAGGQPLPVLAVREVGGGRSMALMGDSSWRWVMAEAALGHGNQAYLRFWKNALRWLIKDPEAQPVQVETTRENYRVADTVRVVVKVRDVGFEPLENALVVGEIHGPGDPVPFEAVTDAFGEALVEVPAGARGAYRVLVTGTSSGFTIGAAETVFAVTERDPELDEVAADARFLAALAEATDGRHYAAGDYGAPLRDESAGRRVLDRVETPLWRAPGLALLAGLLASISWILRRRSGFR
jgi:uncharacterized membrane protein